MKGKTIGSLILVVALMLATILPICTKATEGETQPTTTETRPTTSEIEPTVPTTQPSTPPATEPEVPDGTFKISDAMMTVLKEMEGFSEHAYWDYSQWSIGYGSECPAEEVEYYRKDKGGNKISKEYAEQLLRKELDYFEKEVNDFVKEHDLVAKNGFGQNQYDALVSFTYNTGAGWTKNITGNFSGAVFAGDKGTHLLYGFMLWSMAGNEHILIGRRIVEMNIYANGIYDSRGQWDVSARPDQYRIAFMDGNGGVVKYDEHGFDTKNVIPIKTQFKSRPTGPDETGVQVTYELDGWYTQRVGGTKVEMLDESIPTGTVLYAHWKTPTGKPVVIPPVDTGMKLTVQVTANGVNIRTGPQTYYLSVGKANAGDVLEITQVTRGDGTLWGRFGDQWICLDYTDYATVLSKTLPMWGVVTANTLNVRKDAGTSYDSVGVTLKKGDKVLVKEWKTDGSIMWGKIEQGWIALPYVSFENADVTEKTVQSVSVHQAPAKQSYVHMTEKLDVTGGKILITFSDGSKQILDMTPEMVTGFDNSKVGTNTLTITYETQTASMEVQIVKAKVIFKMDDGTVISEQEYLVGETVAVPADPTKPADSNGYYIFTGWDKAVAEVCNGNATYQAVFEQKKVTGDCNTDGKINDQDAIYLLRHVYFPSRYPMAEPADYNKDGKLNDQDAIYLLRHVYFPNRYPLS